MDPIYIYAKKGHMLIFLITTLIFTLMGALLTIYGLFESGETGSLIAGFLILLPSGLGLIYFFKKIKRPKPALVIAHEGVYDYSSAIGAGLVRWEDIQSLKYSRIAGHLYLCISTKDPNLIIDRMTGMKKMLLRMNRKMLPGQVNIAINTLAYSNDQLHQDIEAAWKHSVSCKQAK